MHVLCGVCLRHGNLPGSRPPQRSPQRAGRRQPGASPHSASPALAVLPRAGRGRAPHCQQSPSRPQLARRCTNARELAWLPRGGQPPQVLVRLTSLRTRLGPDLCSRWARERMSRLAMQTYRPSPTARWRAAWSRSCRSSPWGFWQRCSSRWEVMWPACFESERQPG